MNSSLSLPTNGVISSTGRVSVCGADGCEFESHVTHCNNDPVDELVKSPPFHGGEFGFEPQRGYEWREGYKHRQKPMECMISPRIEYTPLHTAIGSVAQSVEHLAVNQEVGGSSPPRSAIP